MSVEITTYYSVQNKKLTCFFLKKSKNSFEEIKKKIFKQTNFEKSNAANITSLSFKLGTICTFETSLCLFGWRIICWLSKFLPKIPYSFSGFLLTFRIFDGVHFCINLRKMSYRCIIVNKKFKQCLLAKFQGHELTCTWKNKVGKQSLKKIRRYAFSNQSES